MAQLVRQAAAEGHLDLAWSPSFGGQNGRDLGAWMAAFNRFYGLHITDQYTPAANMPQMAGELVQEATAGAPAATDLYIGSPSTTLTVLNGQGAKTYDWSALGQGMGVAVPPQAIAPGNGALAFASAVYGMDYSKKAVPASEVPHTLAAVLQPRWKGKVASNSHATGLYQLAFFSPQWGGAKTTAFVTALSRQVGGLVRCGDPSPLLSGQFDIVAECDVSSALEWQRQGLPIGYVVPTDAPASDYEYFVVPKTSRDPAVAALFALFMLTPQGQSLSWSSDAQDLILLPASHDRTLLLQTSVPIAGLDGVAGLMAHPDALKYDRSLVRIMSRTGG